MTKISLELDTALNKRLKRYVVDHFEDGHGKQQGVIRMALRTFLDANAAIEDPANEPEGEIANEPVKAMSRSKPKRKTTRKSPITEEDQIKIKGLWDEGERTGERNISAIAKQFPQYSDRQVRHWIDRNIRT